jgi:hypothetical protein
VFENLEKSKKGQGPLVSRSYRLNGLHRSAVRARDTMSSDAAVTACLQWPPPNQEVRRQMIISLMTIPTF